MSWRLGIVVLICGLPLAHAADVDVTLPETTRVALDNGTVLIVNAKDDVPLVGLEVRIRGGAVRDPDDKAGTASLFAGLLERGAADRDAQAFVEAVESVGGRLSARAELESIRIRGEFLSRDLDLMLELVGDMILRPTLAEDELDTLRERRINFIRAAKDSNPGALMPTYAAGFLFGEHPYGTPVSGSETSLGGIALEDVQGFYANEVGGDRLIISVSGDIEPDAVVAKLSDMFGAFRPAALEPEPLPLALRASTRRVLLIDKPGATQTWFWIGNLGVAIDFPERAELDIANTVFGGRFTSMLNTALRVESGLTYGARSLLVRPSEPGSIAISSYTRTDATVQAIDMALNVLYRLRTDGLDELTLQSAQNYILGSFPTRLETARQLAAQFAMLELYGLDESYINDYASLIDAVTLESVTPVIDDIYPADGELVFVILGDAAEIRDAVSRYGAMSELSITDPVFAVPVMPADDETTSSPE